MRTLVIVLASLVVILFGVAMYYYGKSQTPATATDPAATTIDPNSLSSAATVNMPGREVVSAPNMPVMPPPPPAWEPDPFQEALTISNKEYDHRVFAASSVRGVIQNTSTTTVYTNVVLQLKFQNIYNEVIVVKEKRIDEMILPQSVVSFKIFAEKPASADSYNIFVISADPVNVTEVLFE